MEKETIEEIKNELVIAQASADYYQEISDKQRAQAREVMYVVLSAGVAAAIAVSMPILIYGWIWS